MRRAEEMFKSSQYQTMINFMQERDKNYSFVDNELPMGTWKNNPSPISGRKKGLKLVTLFLIINNDKRVSFQLIFARFWMHIVIIYLGEQSLKTLMGSTPSLMQTISFQQ